jgi:hypothetical protein
MMLPFLTAMVFRCRLSPPLRCFFHYCADAFFAIICYHYIDLLIIAAIAADYYSYYFADFPCR